MGDYDPDNPFSPMNDVASMPTSNPIASGLAYMATLPGEVMKPNPYEPGSEQAYSYNDQRSEAGLDWANNMALNMVGGSGVVPAEANALRTGVGIKARGIDPASFEQFTRNETRGVDPGQNFKFTNWYRGDDGQPRYWVSDKNAQLKDIALTPGRKIGNIDAKVPGRLYDESNPIGRDAKLGDVYDHPELYDAYPWLKDVSLRPEDRPGRKGAWSPSENKIYARQDEPGEFQRTLAHEVQHVIQDHEGFSPGSHKESFYPQNYTGLLKELKSRLLDANGLAKGLGIDTADAWNLSTMDPGKIPPDKQDVFNKLNKYGLVDEYKALKTAYGESENIQNEAFQRYRHTAGESEARDTEAIMKDPSIMKPGMVPLHVNPDLQPGRQIQVLPAGPTGTKAFKGEPQVPFAMAYPENKIYHVDPAKVDAAWSQDKGFHVGPGGTGESASKFKYDRAKKFLADAKTFDAPDMGVQSNGAIGFTDGRHRFAAMRDMAKGEPVPVAMDPESAMNARNAGYMADGYAAGGGVQDNPFDQFDAPAAQPAPQGGGGNPFDQFDSGAGEGDKAAAPMSWGDVGKQALENTPRSAANFAYDLAQPFMHPIETANSIKNIGLGLGEKAGILSGDEHKQYPDAVGHFFANRYGGMENFKKSLAEDPVGVAGDLSMLLGGGETALARAPGIVGRVGEAAGTASRLLDPISTGISAGVNRAGNALGSRLSTTTRTPSTEDLFEAANNNYRNMRGYGVEIDPRAVSQVHTNIMTELWNEGYRPSNAPKTLNAVDELLDQQGRYHTIDDIEAPRKALNRAAADPAERDAARRATQHIDDFLANLNPRDVRVNPQFAGRVAQEAQEARSNWGAARRSELISDQLEKAGNRAGSTGAGGNLDNATRQNIRAILDSRKLSRGFNDAERAQMRTIARGTPTGNALRLAGKFAPTGIVSMGVSGALAHAAGLPWWLPGTVGYGLKKAADFTTSHNVGHLQEQVSRRSALGAATPVYQNRAFVGRTPFQVNRLKGQLADDQTAQKPERLYVSPDNPYATNP